MTPRAQLDALLADHREELSEPEREAFEDIAETLSNDPRRKLSAKQENRITRVHERFAPVYENLASSGGLVVGRPVETPAVLRPENLPKKPPGRW